MSRNQPRSVFTNWRKILRAGERSLKLELSQLFDIFASGLVLEYRLRLFHHQ
jgi:hypothetical protein